MSRFRTLLLVVCLSLFPAPGLGAQDQEPLLVAEKTGTTAASLLLPLFVVDTQNATGTTTFWAIRNESASSVDVTIRYFERDQPGSPQAEEMVTLGPRAVRTANVRGVPDLRSDLNGFARGFVLFETEGGAIHGDYFQLNSAENFASGSRLVNIDPESNSNDLCNRFSMRFLNSELFFDSGTIYSIWFDATPPFEGFDLGYVVYNQAGGSELLSGTVPITDAAVEISAEFLLSGPIPVNDEFGAIEFTFPAGTVGHISATLSAFGRFSVGFEATCLDSI